MALALVFFVISLGLLTGPSADGQDIEVTTSFADYLCKVFKRCVVTEDPNSTEATTEATTETKPIPPTPRPGSSNCTCVPRNECKTKRLTIDLRFEKSEDYCPHYLQTCCTPDNIIPPTPPPTATLPPPPSATIKPPVTPPQTPPVTPTQTPPVTPTQTPPVTGNVTPPSGTPKPTQNPMNRCGIRNFDGIGFKAKGTTDEAQYGEFPWMVAVMRQAPSETSGSSYQCGGSLIHPQVVLTVAHCVNGRSGLFIRAGEWDTQTENEDYDTQDRTVNKVIIHDQYNNETAENGVALLILEEPVDMTAMNVGRICLPESQERMEGRPCVATGWGKDVFGKEGKYQVILKRVDLPIVPSGICQESLRQTRLGNDFILQGSFLCAGGFAGKDTCTGDGGSPLVCPSLANPNIYVQAGVVSWGVGCKTETPAVYVNVPRFVNWIRDKAEEEGFPIDD